MKPHTTHNCRHFGPLMGYCDHQVHKLMDLKLRSLDISPMQSRVLAFLYHAENEVNQRALEQFLMVKPSTVNGIVSRLEEKGLITRTTSDQDGRCRILCLTEQGRSYHHRFKDVIEQVETQMEQGFTTEELALLRRLLLRVADNLTVEAEEETTP